MIAQSRGIFMCHHKCIVLEKKVIHEELNQYHFRPFCLYTNDVIIEQYENNIIKHPLKSRDFVQSVLPVSQCVPVYPGAHVQLYWFTASTQVAPFSHGELAHSSTSKHI